MSTIAKGSEAGKLLNGYIAAIEHTRERKKQIGDEEKAAFAAAEADGFDKGTLRTVLKLRTLDREKRIKQDGLLTAYLHALGMDDSPTLFSAVGMMGIDIAMREQVIAALEQFVPASGDIVVRVPGGAPVRLWRNESGAVEVQDMEAAEASSLRRTPKRDPLDTYDRDTEDGGKVYAAPGGLRGGYVPKSVIDRIADAAEAMADAKRKKEAKAAGVSPPA